MTIFVDDRQGSAPSRISRVSKSGHKFTRDYKGVIDYPPLSTCLDCQSPTQFKWASRTATGQPSDWICSSGNRSHTSLALLSRLDSGDVCFSGNGPNGPILIGVEIKSITELATSLLSGRFQAISDPESQIRKMVDTYDMGWVVVYGNYRSNPDPGPLKGSLQVQKWRKGKVVWEDFTVNGRSIAYSYVESFLVSPSFLSTGLHSHKVLDMAEVATWVGGTLYPVWSKPYDKHKSMRVFNKSQDISIDQSSPLALSIDPPTLLRAKVASQFPGVGFERALAIAQHSPSPLTVSASKSGLEKVKGIGKVLARSIEGTINEAYWK